MGRHAHVQDISKLGRNLERVLREKSATAAIIARRAAAAHLGQDAPRSAQGPSVSVACAALVFVSVVFSWLVPVCKQFPVTVSKVYLLDRICSGCLACYQLILVRFLGFPSDPDPMCVTLVGMVQHEHVFV